MFFLFLLLPTVLRDLKSDRDSVGRNYGKWKLLISYIYQLLQAGRGGHSREVTAPTKRAVSTEHAYCSLFQLVVGSPSLLLHFQVVKIIIIPQLNAKT